MPVTMSPDQDGYYCLAGDIPEAAIEGLAGMGSLDKLKVTNIPLVTVRLAKRLVSLKVAQLWLWCDITRPAMRHLIELPELRVMDILCIRGPGQLANFRKAHHLEVFRANHYMTERDLLQVTQCASLREIGAQNAELSTSVISAFMALPNLTTLDLEATRFDDRMARRICASKTLATLDLGGTRITRVGLAHLAGMQQLRSLDLWATELKEDDLKLLLNLPNLEYLSLGGYDHLPSLDPAKVTSLLLNIAGLKRVWLDGVRLEPEQRGLLESRLESVRIT